MSRLIPTIFTITLVLSFMLSCSCRPDPTISVNHPPLEIEEEAEKIEVDENCEGIGGEECLMRRTLVAHVDYIYTQKHKP